MNLDHRCKAHFIVEEDDNVFSKTVIVQIPRVGDTLRFSEERYFKVTRVIWVYDEPEAQYSRVNIGMIPD